MTEFFNSFLSTITAFGTLLCGITSVFIAFPKSRDILTKLYPLKKKIKEHQKVNNMKKIQYSTFAIGLFFMICSIGIFIGQKVFAQNIPLNQKLTEESWDYFNNKEYYKSIDKANECIKLFRGQAEIKQEELVKKNSPKPNTNPNKKEKDEINSHGLLNDVATCYYIKGLCFQELNKKEEAISSYTKAEFYTYAMCWDSQGWFWNISEAITGTKKSVRNMPNLQLKTDCCSRS